MFLAPVIADAYFIERRAKNGNERLFSIKERASPNIHQLVPLVEVLTHC